MATSQNDKEKKRKISEIRLYLQIIKQINKC